MTKSNRTLQCLFLIMMLVCGIGFANAQQLAVSGTVTDHTGEPLIGVTVTVSGTKTGAITDIDGKYSIQAGHPLSEYLPDCSGLRHRCL